MSSETFTPDRLFAGTYPVVGDSLTVLSGEVCARGTLMGKISASGKLVLCDTDGTDDGRRTPHCILAEAVDATDGDVVAPVYLTGEFDENEVTFATGETAATHKDALRAKGIFLKSVTAA